MTSDAERSPRCAGCGCSRGTARATTSCSCPTPTPRVELTPAQVRALTDRHTGLGADGVLRVVPTATSPEVADQAADARWFMDYRNADGSTAEMCGNGARVFARYLVDSGLETGTDFSIATRGGACGVRIESDGDVTIGMGTATTPAAARDAGRHAAPPELERQRRPRAEPALRRVPRRPRRARRRSTSPSRPWSRRARCSPTASTSSSSTASAHRRAPRTDACARARRRGDAVVRHRRVSRSWSPRRRATTRPWRRRTPSTCPGAPWS